MATTLQTTSGTARYLDTIDASAVACIKQAQREINELKARIAELDDYRLAIKAQREAVQA